jgi:protoporphyrinogen oxidase
MSQKRAIIIGAGPAGLTAALELIRHTDIQPVVLEASQVIGGISRTVEYKGYRMDIGGHRFFSKSDRVMNWWKELMPVSETENEELAMLIRPRKSRIYFLRRFFDYPIRLTGDTIWKMGLLRTLVCGLSYMKSAAFPLPTEKTLEDFLINRFGKTLYETFFKDYTEKVWGVPCHEISSEWGAQRIKGLSLRSAIWHYVKKVLISASGDLAQKQTETSLIEKFLYPRLGPGQLWQRVAELVVQGGGELHMGVVVDKIEVTGNRVVAVEGIKDNKRIAFTGEHFFSTMPVRELIQSISSEVPENVREVSEGLVYRDFITVGLLVDKLAVSEVGGGLLKDNWIYIQEPDVQVGRLQIFNNWSPWLLADQSKVWIGLEYFCFESNPIWSLPDEEMVRLAIGEVVKIGLLKAEDVRDSHVVHVPKTYPAYFGTYDRFEEIRTFLDGFENLFLMGRNGMHKYNNQDHSMLTAMTAVENIINGVKTKDNLWSINTETDYHEEKQGQDEITGRKAGALNAATTVGNIPEHQQAKAW